MPAAGGPVMWNWVWSHRAPWWVKRPKLRLSNASQRTASPWAWLLARMRSMRRMASLHLTALTAALRTSVWPMFFGNACSSLGRAFAAVHGSRPLKDACDANDWGRNVISPPQRSFQNALDTFPEKKSPDAATFWGIYSCTPLIFHDLFHV